MFSIYILYDTYSLFYIFIRCSTAFNRASKRFIFYCTKMCAEVKCFMQTAHTVVQACVNVCICSVICMHACVSWTRLLSGCITPPKAQDSTVSLRVTHGETAPCPRRTAGITGLSLSVTLALSSVVPPRWQVEEGGGAL